MRSFLCGRFRVPPCNKLFLSGPHYSLPLSPACNVLLLLLLCLYRTCPLCVQYSIYTHIYIYIIVGVGRQWCKLIGPRGYLKLEHLCRWTLGGKRHRYAIAYPDELGASEPIGVDVIEMDAVAESVKKGRSP